MKLIFSRKGFDSSAGGIPSPILPDGRLLPMPIPQADGPVKFSQLRFEGQTLSSIIKQLGGKCWRERCHLDPDLDAALMERPESWLPAFGQSGSAQRHLEQEGVGVGDLFLFFGWFRQTERVAGKLRFVPGAPDLHVLHSWLQVGQVCSADQSLLQRLPGLQPHPHLHKDYPFNTLYLPTELLEINGQVTGLAGSGLFPQWSESHQLTWPGELRSVWRLPPCFWPERCDPVMSYHRQRERWQWRDGKVQLNAAYRGQEFVVACMDEVEMVAWLKGLGLGR